MFVTTDDGVRLNVEMCGREDAPAILMMHSIGCDLTLWDPQVESLAHDFRVVRYDARGHGGSDAPPGDYTLERLGQDALAVLDAVGVGRAYLCGLSLGGVTAKWLALNAPERIAGIVLADTAVRIGTAEAWQARADMALEQGMQAIAPTALGRFFSSQFQAADPDTVDRFRGILLGTDPQGWAGCCAVLRDADFTGQLGAIVTPAIVVGGTLDVPTPLAQAEELASLIPGARLVALDAGHLSNIEQPEDFTHAVRSIFSVAVRSTPAH
jgi:3-oxoadipate enol-lactonase